MADAVTIPRLPDPPKGKDWPPEVLGEGWWWAPSTYPLGMFDLVLRTPAGQIGRLVTRLHAINPAGIVSPSIKITGGGGPEYHVMGTLGGWTAEDAARPRP